MRGYRREAALIRSGMLPAAPLPVSRVKAVAAASHGKQKRARSARHTGDSYGVAKPAARNAGPRPAPNRAVVFPHPWDTWPGKPNALKARSLKSPVPEAAKPKL